MLMNTMITRYSKKRVIANYWREGLFLLFFWKTALSLRIRYSYSNSKGSVLDISAFWSF